MMAGGGQGYLFLVLSPFARRGILFVSGLFHLPYFPSRLPVSSQQSRKHTPRYSSTYIKAKRQHLSHHDQSLISHLVVRSDKRLNQPQCSSSSRPSTNHRTYLSQHDSRTSSSSQPSALDLALRLFHTRRPQRCICSISLAATHQGSEDPHHVRSELITSSPDRMFGVIELSLGEEWFGVSRSTTAADKATYKRS
ncbi:hypothetical protein M438DRAFT_43733 [Aureobasidium pullulans EXF-150]|uniref:Uncharacterized protein n=1 Tax=Aureobasidium pullulans EXF-150 TaxID=1043002 RepID=A0A074XCI4_AURPU|nr:uncharacterized protein M438DRAFT_43733 [Aureobasidium pullulans EXF-150]KEQ83210.1 hypothetical protein M438DRAFT_43733 [Aureobasidium pullulans EXF-150]